MNREGWTTDRFKQVGDAAWKKYRKIGRDLFTFVIGACMEKLGVIQLDTTQEEKEAADKYLRSVYTGDGSEMSHFRDLVYAIFTEDQKNRQVFDVLAYRFLMLYSFRRDGSVKPCNDITQIISGMVYHARGSILQKIQSEMDARKVGFHM